MRGLRVIFAVVGSLATLLAIGTVVMAVVFYTPGAFGRAVWGGALYFGIAVACFYACYRINVRPVRRGGAGSTSLSPSVATRPADDPPQE